MRHLQFVKAAVLVCATACGGEAAFDESRSPAGRSGSVNLAPALRITTISTTEIDLAWQETTLVNGWEVFRSSGGASVYSRVWFLFAPGASYADTGLAASTVYCYQIRSWRMGDGPGPSYSAFVGPVCATTLAPPLPLPPPQIGSPNAVRAMPVREDLEAPYNSGVHITWADKSTNEDEFRIEEASSAAGPWTQKATAAADSTSADRYGVREEQICFRVTAANASRTSSPSAPACTTPPANPTNLSAATTVRGIDLAWTDNSAFEDGYKISRLDASGFWSEIATLPANATRYSDADVSTDATYTYRVQALKDGGASDYSNEAAGAVPTAVPAAPADVVAMYYSDLWGGWLYLDVSWTDLSGNETGFRIEESADGISGWTTVSGAPANQRHALEQYDQYAFPSYFDACYRVVAFNSLGDSDPSNVFCTGWGGAPQNLVATAVDSHTVEISWTGVARFASGYDVGRIACTPSSYSCYQHVASLPPGATSFRETGLAAGQEYQYYVTVTYPGDPGDFYNTAWVVVTTPP